MKHERDTKPSPGRRSDGRRALAVSLAIPVLAVVTVFIAAGAIPPPFGAEPGRESRAAVVLRDDVTPFQEWGTRAFTYGQLAANYGHVEYLTQEPGDAKHAAFVTALRAALESHDHVDLFLLAHTNSFIDWVSEIDPGLRRRIRLVYNTGCWGAAQADDWLGAKADAYVGHPGESESEVFYVYFLRRWLRGSSVREAVEASNRDTRTFLRLSRRLLFGERPFDELWTATRAAAFGADGVAIAARTDQ
ncbi:MAG: hypothetical protein PVH00_06435 [Gemmatimonadota bacterium]